VLLLTLLLLPLGGNLVGSTGGGNRRKGIVIVNVIVIVVVVVVVPPRRTAHIGVCCSQGEPLLLVVVHVAHAVIVHVSVAALHVVLLLLLLLMLLMLLLLPRIHVSLDRSRNQPSNTLVTLALFYRPHPYIFAPQQKNKSPPNSRSSTPSLKGIFSSPPHLPTPSDNTVSALSTHRSIKTGRKNGHSRSFNAFRLCYIRVCVCAFSWVPSAQFFSRDNLKMALYLP